MDSALAMVCQEQEIEIQTLEMAVRRLKKAAEL
jgi:hypothetical protein